MSLTDIALVPVPVTDQDRALSFYVDVLGFSVKADYVMDADVAGSAGPGARWVMLSPPGGRVDVTLTTWYRDVRPPGSAQVSIRCDDIDDTHADLVRRGGEPAGSVVDAPWGRSFGITDPDGNSWLIVEPQPDT